MTERPEPPYSTTLKIAKWGAIGICMLATMWLGLNLPTDVTQFLNWNQGASALETAGAVFMQNLPLVGLVFTGFAAYQSADKAETIASGMKLERVAMRAAAKAHQPYLPELHALHDREQQVPFGTNLLSGIFGAGLLAYGALTAFTMAPLIATATPFLLTMAGLGLAAVGAAVIHTTSFAGRARKYAHSPEGIEERNFIIDTQYHHHLSQVESRAHSLLSEINAQREQYNHNPMPADYWRMKEMQRRMQTAQEHLGHAGNSIRMH